MRCESSRALAMWEASVSCSLESWSTSVNDHRRATGWQPAVPIDEWAEEAGFADVKDLAYVLLRRRRVREHQACARPL